MNLTKDTPRAALTELMTIHMSEGEPTWAQVGAFHRSLLPRWEGKPLSEITTWACIMAVSDVLLSEACKPEPLEVDAEGFYIRPEERGHPEYDAESQFERFSA